ncbi:hypothetical protein ACWDTP_03725 [Mycobacterium sp. NPDC003449]
MKPVVQRLCLIILTGSGLFVGLWAYFAPLHWFNTFPGLGMRWLPALGRYNEHFAKDVGAMYLALAALSAAALFRLANRTLILVAAVSWTVFNLLHLIYHATMLHMYGPRDAILNVVALGVVLLCSVVLVIPPAGHAGHLTRDSSSPSPRR